MTSLLLPVWAVLSWLAHHSSGLYCIVLHLYSCYQTFISLSLYAGYYWQRVLCTMHQTYTGKLLLAVILVWFCFFFFFGSAIRLQHTWFVLVALHGVGTQNEKRRPYFSKQRSGITPQYSSLRLAWLRTGSDVSYKHLIPPPPPKYLLYKLQFSYT